MTIRRFVLAVCSLVALSLLLPSSGEAGEGQAVQVDEARARFLASAEKAIRSREGGVFVVEIQASHAYRGWSFGQFWLGFTVEEVLKPYRKSKGAYFIPLMINTRPPDGKLKLRVGKRYLIVTGTSFALILADSLEIAPGDDKLLEELRRQTDKHAVYGSSSGLRKELDLSEFRGPELYGVQTRHANGLVDPEPFGFKRDELREAVRNGESVLLVRRLDSRGDEWKKSREWLFDVREDLARPDPTRKKLWVYDAEPVEKRRARSKKMPAPYKLPHLNPHRSYIILVEPRGEGNPLLKAFMPVISDDGPTVRKIRSWLQERTGVVRVRFELDGKPYAAKGLPVSLGATQVVCSDKGATFEEVKPGKHQLSVDRIEGLKSIAAREVEVESGKTIEVVISLERVG